MDYGYEAELDLKDLLLFIFYKWRTILITAVITGILLAGYKFICNETESLSASGKPKETREYELALAEYELAIATCEQDIDDYQMRLAQQNLYMEKSVLMQVDPYEKPSATADIFVKLDDSEWTALPNNVNMDPTDSLIAIYASNLPAYINWEEIEQITGKESIFLKELLGIVANYDSNTFTIQIVYNDGSLAQQILDAIIDQILAKYQDMGADVSKHTISVVNKTLTYSIDTSLVDRQKANADTIATYEQAIIDCRRTLEEMEKDKPTPPNGIRKFFVLGFAAGIFFAVAFHGMAYLFGGRLHSEHELKEKYGYRLLVNLSMPKNILSLSAVGRLSKRKNGTTSQTLPEEKYRIIAANIANLAEGGKRVLMTGTVETGKLQKLAEAVAPQLQEFTLVAAADMNLTANTLRELARCDAVILVEECHWSLMKNIQKENDCIAASGKPVVGYILL